MFDKMNELKPNLVMNKEEVKALLESYFHNENVIEDLTFCEGDKNDPEFSSFYRFLVKLKLKEGYPQTTNFVNGHICMVNIFWDRMAFTATVNVADLEKIVKIVAGDKVEVTICDLQIKYDFYDRNMKA